MVYNENVLCLSLQVDLNSDIIVSLYLIMCLIAVKHLCVKTKISKEIHTKTEHMKIEVVVT